MGGLLRLTFGLQGFDAALETLVGGQYAKAAANCDSANENIDGVTLNSVILEKIEEAGGLDVISRGDFPIEERIEQLSRFGELRRISDPRKHFLAYRAEDGHAPVLNRFAEFG